MTRHVPRRFWKPQRAARFSGGPGARAVDQTPAFGALTLAGAGGFQLVDNRGVALTNATDDGTGTASGYSLSAGGIITPSTDGSLSAQDGATIDFSSDQGSATVTLSILAGDYSAANIAQLEVAAEVPPDRGQSVWLRGGDYNTAKNDVRIRPAALPAGSSGFVTIQPHSGETANIYRLGLEDFDDTGRHFRFFDLDFIGEEDASFAQGDLFRFNNGGQECEFDTCRFTGPVVLPENAVNLPNGIGANVAGNNTITIRDCAFTNLFKGFVLKGQDGVATGNTITGAWADGLQITSPCANLLLADNTIRDKKHPYTPYSIVSFTTGNPTDIELEAGAGANILVNEDVVLKNIGETSIEDRAYNISAVNGDTITVEVDSAGLSPSGGTAQHTTVHDDFIQFSLSGASVQADVANVQILRNILDTSQGTEVYGGGQGIFLDDNTPSMTGLIIRGNFVRASTVRLISVSNADGALIEQNTAIVALGIRPEEPSGAIHLVAGSNNEVRRNVTNAISDGATGSVIEDNVATIAKTLTDYQAVFSNPQTGQHSPTLPDDYVPVASSVLDPGRGIMVGSIAPASVSPTWVDYDADTIDLPYLDAGWAPTFTDQTGLATNTTVTSNKLQASGLSATGALCSVSGGTSPTLAIYESDGTTVKHAHGSDAVIFNDEWLELQDTTSGSGATKVDVTATIGANSDTWSHTTA